jgi:uracil phosphoribosyltransferase
LVILVDPMLATGHSASAAVARLKQAGVPAMKFVCLLAAPEGIATITREHPDVPIFTGAIDRALDSHGYIRPGLGDAGDRFYGTR